MTSLVMESSPREARTIIALAEALTSDTLRLDAVAPAKPDDSIKKLTELPGIGQWTAHYIAMRALRWPDAFPKEDIAVRNNLGGVSAKEAELLSASHGDRGEATRSCTCGAWRRFEPSCLLLLYYVLRRQQQ